MTARARTARSAVRFRIAAVIAILLVAGVGISAVAYWHLDRHAAVEARADRSTAAEAMHQLHVSEERDFRWIVGLTFLVLTGAAVTVRGILRLTDAALAERDNAMRGLREHEALLRTSQALAHLGTWAWDFATNTFTYSEEFYRIVGATPDQLGHTMTELLPFVHPDDRAVIQEREARARGASPEDLAPSFEWRLVRPDGEERLIWSQADTEYDTTGRPVRRVGAALDITERRRAEVESRAREGRLRFHVERTPMGVIACDVAGRVTEWNPAAEQIFGYRHDDALGRRLLDLVVPPDAREDVDQVARALHQAEPRPHVINENLTRSGRRITCEWLNTPLHDGAGEFVGVACMVRDITEAQRVATELQRFQTTLNQTHDCVFMFAPDTLRFFYVNQGAVNQVGYTQDELLRMTPIDIKPEFTESRFRSMIEPLLEATQRSVAFETVHRHKDGTDIPVEVLLQYVAPVGEEGRFVAMVRDITERRQAEAALRLSEERLARAEAMAHLGNWHWDVREGTVDLSAEIYRVLGVFPDEFAGTFDALLGFIHPDDVAVLDRALEVGLAELAPIRLDCRIRRHDGRPRWVSIEAEMEADPAGEPVRVVGTLQDITRRKLAEHERERLIAELRDALAEVNTLSGMLPICASCKKIRDDKGYWQQIESFIQARSDAQFSHSVCPSCAKALYPDLYTQMFPELREPAPGAAVSPDDDAPFNGQAL